MVGLFQRLLRRVRGIGAIDGIVGQISALERELDLLKVMQAKILSSLQPREFNELTQAEFRAFSQYGEDGIIQYIIAKLSLPRERHVAVEIGCENFREANTRLLLELNHWRSIVFDGSVQHIKSAKLLECAWRLNFEAHTAFISRENINETLRNAGVPSEIGLLSCDIDGNDYWAWEALNATSPIAVVIEYNGLFGADRAVAVPYDAKFNRFIAHPSGLYWGCSIRALELLGTAKGYSLIGSNSAGCNAFFVRNDWARGFRKLTATEAYRRSLSRDGRQDDGHFDFCGFEEQRRRIAHLPIIDIEQSRSFPLAEVFTTTAQ